MNEFMDRLKKQLMADKKKFGVMVALLVVGLLLWGRLMLKSVPRTATAAPVATAVSAAPVPVTQEPGERGEVPVATVVVALPDTLGRDLFALDRAAYRKAKNSANDRSMQNLSPDTTDIKIRRDEALSVARGMRLESVVLGESPSVVIGGQLFGVGQQVDGMTIVRIERRRVLVEMSGVHIWIRL